MSPNRVPWKEYVLAVSTFPDGLQGPTKTRKMGQNVLTKQSASRLVSATCLDVTNDIHCKLTYKSGACANSGYQDLFFPPPRKGTGYEAKYSSAGMVCI